MNYALIEWFKKAISPQEEDINNFSKYVESRGEDVFHFIFYCYMREIDRNLILKYMSVDLFNTELDNISDKILGLQNEMGDKYQIYEKSYRDCLLDIFSEEESTKSARS